MLISVYLFALVLGGVLLAASLFLGGDAEADVDVDADVDLDADADADAGGHGHALPAHADAAADGLAGLFTTLASLRFWTFFAAFFGLTGAMLDGANLVEGTLTPLLAAIAMGVGAGFVAVRVLRGLMRSPSGAVATANDYIGKSGRVLLPFRGLDLGKIRLEIGGTTVDALAQTEDADHFRTGDEALVVEMRQHIAFVTRLDRDIEDRHSKAGNAQ